jgi:hypothetical protein
MLKYFMEQDLVPLEKENWGRFKIGDACNKCEKGHLQMAGKKEDTGTSKLISFFRCNYCASEFKNYRTDASDTICLK